MLEQIKPFLIYLNSSIELKKISGFKYFYRSEYYINICETERDIQYALMGYIYWGGDLEENEKYSHHLYNLPETIFYKYIKICISVIHHYVHSNEKIYGTEKDLIDAYKLEQCVICLDNKPNILYNPCLHYCVCSQCGDKGKFENCPYCREGIEECVLIKSYK